MEIVVHLMGNETNYNSLAAHYDELLRGQKGAYLAVPITSGKRLWELAREKNVGDVTRIRDTYPVDFQNNVFKPNCVDAHCLANALGTRLAPRVVIDPSTLVVSKWKAEDYHAFWKFIIQTRVSDIYLSPGWAYSYGCVAECLEGLRQELPLRSFDGTSLDKKDIHEELEKRSHEALGMSLRADFLSDALHSLSTIRQ
jgi:hypothetical protein